MTLANRYEREIQPSTIYFGWEMTKETLPELIGTERLTDALRRSGLIRENEVTDVTIEDSTETVLSHIFRLRLTYCTPTVDAPKFVMLKAGLAHRAGGPWEAGRHEVAFYQTVASAMSGHLVPHCFDACWDEVAGTWHLVLEDLSTSHFTVTQWPLPPTLRQCESIIRTRAKFQSAWWDDARLGVTVGEWQDADALSQSVQRLTEQFEKFANDLGDGISPARRDLYARLIDAAPRLAARYHSRRHMTVVQGDAHVWNCFLPRDEGTDGAVLFDWDSWRVDVGSDDLAYMMAVHWYPDLRHRVEQHLLDCYHDELVASGVSGYDRRALDDDYRLSVLWQITTPVWQYASNIPPLYWWNNFERIHLAVEDLGCRELLN
jgi:hypothetical protein